MKSPCPKHADNGRWNGKSGSGVAVVRSGKKVKPIHINLGNNNMFCYFETVQVMEPDLHSGTGNSIKLDAAAGKAFSHVITKALLPVV